MNLISKNIRAVLFDFDGTLRHNRPDANEFFFDFAVSIGAEETGENRKAAYRWAHSYWNSDGGVREDKRAFGENSTEFWVNYCTRYLLSFGCSPSQAEALAPHVNAHMSNNYSPIDWVDPKTPELLTNLREQNLHLGVVSNRDQPFWRELEMLGLCSLFDFSLSAGEANSWKPNPEIFQKALYFTQTNPEETLYIGDNYFADIVGARNAGLLPVLIDPFDVFPDADCAVIQEIGELEAMIIGN